jgi:hypothetical protein
MKPRLFEAVMKSPGQKESARELYETMKLKIPSHPFFKQYAEVGVKEALFSDSANALGMMHDTLVNAAWPELIGRNIINVMPTSNAMERFPLDGGCVAYKYAQGAMTRLSSKKPSTVDVYTDALADASDAWDKEFVEPNGWQRRQSIGSQRNY